MEKVVVQEKKRGRKRKLDKDASDARIANADPVDGSTSVGTASEMKAPSSASHTPVAMNVDVCNGDAKADSDSLTVGRKIVTGMEGDYHMLEYLQLHGLGKAKRAQFLMMVELCRGTGMCVGSIVALNQI
jgi:hypothetical protein